MSILIGKVECELGSGVVSVRPAEFATPQRLMVKRTRGIDLGVLHWFGFCGPEASHRKLCELGLSVDFLIDGAGTVIQCNPDPTQWVCQHARGVNSRSWGVEIINPKAQGSTADLDVWRETVEEPRPHSLPDEHGRTPTMRLTRFTWSQIEAVVSLCEVMCSALGIHQRLPRDERDNVPLGTKWWDLDAKAVRPIRETFTGVCGHYHVDEKKIDPGSQLWPTFMAYSW